MLQNTYDALMVDDEITFYKALNFSENDTENRKEFMAYIKKQDTQKIWKKLKLNAKLVQKDGITRVITDEGEKEIFRLNQVKKFWLYPTVEIVPIQSTTEQDGDTLHEKGKKTVSVEKLQTSAIFTAVMQNGKKVANLYVIPLDILINELEFSSAFGQEGDVQYEGSFAFFLAEVGDETGVLQEHLSIQDEQLVVNKQNDSFHVKNFGDKTILSLAQVLASNYSEVHMWMYAEDELKEIKFHEENAITVSSEDVRFIGENFVQTYTYFNGMGDPNEGIGWTYTTWKWDPAHYRFEKYYEDAFTDKEQFGWETGEYITGLWNKHENYYVSFPELTFTEDSEKLAMNGMLMKDSIALGNSIDKLLQENPNFVEQSYYEGGPYYTYPGGFSYFYDELTKEITYIVLDGDTLTNSLEEMEQIIGVPADSGYDEMNLEYYRRYYLDKYTLDMRLNENNEISTFWYYETVME